MGMYQPPYHLNFQTNAQKSYKNYLQQRQTRRGIYIFTLPEILADAIHNTFTGPEHNFHQECIVPNDTNVGYLKSDHIRNVGIVSSNSVCVLSVCLCFDPLNSHRLT